MKVKNYAFAGFMAAILSGAGAMAADKTPANPEEYYFRRETATQSTPVAATKTDNMVTSKAYVDVQDAKRVAIFQGADNKEKILEVNSAGMLELRDRVKVEQGSFTTVGYDAMTNKFTVGVVANDSLRDALAGAEKGVEYDTANHKYRANLKENGGIGLDGDSMYVKVDGTTIVNDNGTLKATASDQTASGVGTTVNADHTVNVDVDGTGIVIDNDKVSLKLADGDATTANGNAVDVKYDNDTIKKDTDGKLYVNKAAVDTNTTYTAGDGIDTIGTDNVIKAKVQNGNGTAASVDANGIKVDLKLGNGVDVGTNGLEVKAQNGDATVASVDANGVKVDVQYDGTTITKNAAGKLVATTVDTNVSGKSTWTTDGVISSMQASWTANKCDETHPCALVTDASGNPVWQQIAQIDTTVTAQGLTIIETSGMQPETNTIETANAAHMW